MVLGWWRVAADGAVVETWLSLCADTVFNSKLFKSDLSNCLLFVLASTFRKDEH